MKKTPRKVMGFWGHYESCNMCHHDAWFSYIYNGKILYRCQGHKIVNIDNLESPYHYGSINIK